MHSYAETMGHCHCSFGEFKVHGLRHFDWDIEFHEDFFASCIGMVIRFKVEVGGFYMAIDDVIVLET